jgi:hypothetical protein
MSIKNLKIFLENSKLKDNYFDVVLDTFEMAINEIVPDDVKVIFAVI